MHKIELPDWAVERRRLISSFPPLDPVRTAAVVVDMQAAFVETWSPLYVATTVDILDNINRLTAALREAGGKVVFSRHSFTDEGPGKLPAWQTGASELMAVSRQAIHGDGGRGHEVYSGLTVAPGDLVFDKYRYSCFINAAVDLDDYFQKAGIDTLIVVGTVTNCCCESTARDATMLGYRVLFPSDANAALTDEEHNASLLGLRISVADIATTDEILGRVQAPALT